MAFSLCREMQGVKPGRSATLGLAPLVSSLLTVSASLAPAAYCSGVRPALSVPAMSGRRVVGAFGEPAVDEDLCGADQGDQTRCVDGAPAVLRRLNELERHDQARSPRAGPLGDPGPVPDRREGRLDRVRR